MVEMDQFKVLFSALYLLLFAYNNGEGRSHSYHHAGYDITARLPVSVSACIIIHNQQNYTNYYYNYTSYKVVSHSMSM